MGNLEAATFLRVVGEMGERFSNAHFRTVSSLTNLLDKG